MKKFLHILAAFTVVLVGCSRRGEVIPISTFSSIYADMLIADSWLRDHDEARRQADTCLFYDPIFKRYGYSFEDYDASVDYYLRDPDRMYKVLKKTGDVLKKRQALHKNRKEMQDMVRELASHIAEFERKDFTDDSLLWVIYDSLFVTGTDSLLVGYAETDSVMRDSVSFIPDAPLPVEGGDVIPSDSVRRKQLIDIKR